MLELLLTAYDGSILGPIAKILGWLMNGIYNLMAAVGIENVGLSIIIFTIVMYMLMFPMTYKQQKFSKLSQKMQPELNAIRKKYENKKDQDSVMAMNEETQRVYEKYGVSMTGSCGQMLIQMPVLFALYRVFMNVPAYVNGVKEHFIPLAEGIMSTEGYAAKMTQLVADNAIYTQPAVDFTQTDVEVITNYTTYANFSFYKKFTFVNNKTFEIIEGFINIESLHNVHFLPRFVDLRFCEDILLF